MPYKSNSELPSWVRDMPDHAQDTYRKAFNSAYEQYKDEGKAAATAITAVKRKYEKRGGKWMQKRSLDGSTAVVIEPLMRGIYLKCFKLNGITNITTFDEKRNLAENLVPVKEFAERVLSDSLLSITGTLSTEKPLSKAEIFQALLNGSAAELETHFYVSDCRLNCNSEWVDRQRILVGLAEFYNKCVTLLPSQIITAKEELSDAISSAVVFSGSKGAIIHFADGEESLNISSSSPGTVTYQSSISFAYPVESREEVSGKYCYKLVGVEGITLPTEILAETGSILLVAPASVERHNNITEFKIPSVLGKAGHTATVEQVYGSAWDTLNFSDRVQRGGDSSGHVPELCRITADLADGKYDIGCIYWSDIRLFKTFNRMSSGIISDTANTYKVFGSDGMSIINKSLERYRVTFGSAEIQSKNGIIDSSSSEHLRNYELDFSQKRSKALRSLSLDKSFILLSDKPCNWSYKLHIRGENNKYVVNPKNFVYDLNEIFTENGGNVFGELLFMIGNKIYNYTILNPMSAERDRVTDFIRSDKVFCVRNSTDNAFNFLKSKLGLDEAITLKDIMVSSVLYDLSVKPDRWLDLEGMVSFAEHNSYFKTLSSGTLQLGTQRTDMSELWFDNLGRVILALEPDRIGFNASGTVETLWTFSVAKMQEWYARTHSYEAELDEVSAKRYSLAWQAPGLDTKTYYSKEL